MSLRAIVLPLQMTSTTKDVRMTREDGCTDDVVIVPVPPLVVNT